MFTSDVWTCHISHKSFHWINAILHSSHFTESHYAHAISEKLEKIWDSCNINNVSRHFQVRDDATIISLGAKHFDIDTFHSTINFLQLLIKFIFFSPGCQRHTNTHIITSRLFNQQYQLLNLSTRRAEISHF